MLWLSAIVINDQYNWFPVTWQFMINSYISVLVISECTIKCLNVCTPFVVFNDSYLKRACFCWVCRKACFSISLRKSPWSLARSLAWLPISITRCWSSTATASALWMVESRWAMINTVRLSISLSNASCTRNSFSASRALKQRPGQVYLHNSSFLTIVNYVIIKYLGFS